ncbi:MAG TPA: beta-L-arabinofuranosidase domain-containing protein [Vicinamibacteria bacterium]|nr:beta-L-arabinofuranosidase domain-containing protein [Vicinamibacteria bacterium]
MSSIKLSRRQILGSAIALGVPPVRFSALAQVQLSGSGLPSGLDYPIRSKPFTEVTMKDGFWAPRIERNAAVTIPCVIERFAEHGLPMNNNVLQAAIYSLHHHPDSELQAQVDARIRKIELENRDEVERRNDLFEAAAAHHSITGSRTLLDIALRSAEALYDMHAAEALPFSGGERDALNCIELYRVTGEKKHLALAKYYLDIRGLENSVNRSRHNQSHKPVLEQTEAVGHAVNGATLMLSLLDVAALTGIRDYFLAASRIWRDAVSKKLYITGGIGSTGNEGFGEPYSLPNISAYAETCAGLMFATFNHRMFLMTGDSQYIDVMERSMYNNAIDGVSVSGDRFFYVNRLASTGDGRDTRWLWASLPCCPPNLVRFLASMPGYVYAQGRGGEVYVNLYASSEAVFKIGGNDLHLTVESDMPWGGTSVVRVGSDGPVDGTLKLRIPGWARNQPVPGGLYAYVDHRAGRTRIAVNGRDLPDQVDERGYVSVSRRFSPGDVIEIVLPLEVRRVVAKQEVRATRGRVAVERGPIVYCAEWPDYEGGRVLDLRLDDGSAIEPRLDAELYGGVTTLHGSASRSSDPQSPPKPVRLIPYHLWANRGAGQMTVWISREEYVLGDIGPAGGFIFYINPNYRADGWRYLEAAPNDQSAGAKWGCFREEIRGARGGAIGDGRKNTFDMVAACVTHGTAAELCASYSLNGFSDWFLPSIGELALMYRNLRARAVCDFGDAGYVDNYTYWSSTQVSADMARLIDFPDNGREHYDDKDFPRRVRAVRSF